MLMKLQWGRCFDAAERRILMTGDPKVGNFNGAAALMQRKDVSCLPAHQKRTHFNGAAALMQRKEEISARSADAKEHTSMGPLL